MTKKTAQPQPRRAIGLRRRWIVSSILPVITILVLIAALVSIALGSNYYANARSALEAKATAGTDYFNTYAMTSYDEYFRSATLYANSFEDSASIELQFLDRNGHVEVSTRSLMTGSKPGTKDIIDALTSGRVSSFRGVDPATGEKIIAASGLLKFNGRVVGVMRFVTATRNLDSQVLLTVLIICAAVLAVLLLRSLGVFGTPTTAETTPTPTVPVETVVPTETPTPTPTIESVTIYYGSEPLGDDVTISTPLTVTASIWPMTVEIPAEAIVWESSDTSVATVEQNADDPKICTITGVGAGSCDVTVTVFGASDKVIVRYTGG